MDKDAGCQLPMPDPVFLSYRHESDSHRERVRNLAERLERAGLTVVLDQFAQEREFSHGGPAEGWPRWSMRQAGNPAHKVLIIATPGWCRCYERREDLGLGLGAVAEAGVIEQRLSNRAGVNPDIRVVTFDCEDPPALPLPLQTYHCFTDPLGFGTLSAWLLGRPGEHAGIAVSDWSIQAPALDWPVANHSSVRASFASLLGPDAPGRYLALCGPTEMGKSHVTRLMLQSALEMPGLTCGRFDFKGCTDRDAELQGFVQQLDVPLPSGTGTLNERLRRTFESLRQRARPTLLIFDTYESAGEAQDCIEKQVLPALIRSSWLRVVIAGQQVPPSSESLWESQACSAIQLLAPTVEEWFVFSRSHRPTATLEHVQQAHEYCDGKASILGQLLGPATMALEVQLRILQRTQRDPASLVLAAVDLTHTDLVEHERAALRLALEAAAVAHWCDESILANLLESSQQDSATWLIRLRSLRVVESFRARGAGAINVNESTRLALRRSLAAATPERFRALSMRAATFFGIDPSPAGRVEWIFHLLCYDPERGADALEWLDRNWIGAAQMEHRHALAATLGELQAENLVKDAARVEVMLSIAEFQSACGIRADLEATAREALELARSLKRLSAEGRANRLIGDCLLLQGRLDHARVAFTEYLLIARHLIAQDHRNADWQQELAEAHGRMAVVSQAQGRLDEAEGYFAEDLVIHRRLAERDAGNACWLRGLGVAYNRIGVVLEAQQRTGEALAMFTKGVEISRRLVQLIPSNAEWQRELGVAYWWLAETNQRLGRSRDAMRCYEEAGRIFIDVTTRAPDVAQWAKDRRRVEQAMSLLRPRSSSEWPTY
jgi:tetratricopeptide (TPR) repeat protein